MTKKVTPKIVLVSVAIALFLWATFNNLDLMIETFASKKAEELFFIYSLIQLSMLGLIVYFGAYGKLFQK